jgi:hypothetical protein
VHGDTFVTFAKQGPILYFTVAGTLDSVASSMVRNDGLVGWATSRWSQGRVTTFSARWARPEKVELEISGQVAADTIRLRGAKTDRLAVPNLPWAVADYGMDDQLVPLFMTLPYGTTQAIAVWRPFRQQWDTMSVQTRVHDGVLLISEDAVTWAISPNGRLILKLDRAQTSRRRPLEATARFEEYQAILRLVETSP